MSTPGRGQRPIRSFVLRAGRMTSGQKRALEIHWHKWGLDWASGRADFDALFGRRAPRILEIGFGMGDSLAEMAAARPDTDFIGVEVHRPGVGRLLQTMAQRDIDNIRIYCHDAVEVLRQCIAPAALDGVQVLFPDPWHKKRHHKRRLVQPPFVELLASRLKPGGTVHLATDWEPYAQQMMAVLSASGSLANAFGEGRYAPRSGDRPPTRFERRGERLGHDVKELLFVCR